ncbi:MAG: DUF86 domain-containing protein [Rhodomicrobium sp.]
MSRDVNLVLRDIIDAIDLAIDVCSHMSFEQFCSSRVEKLAVQRTIEIISEAARHLPQAELERYPTIPWRQVKAMGNILRHEYHHLNDKIVWDVVRNELPDLMAKILKGNSHLRSGAG